MVTKCCGCASLKTGTLIIGSLNIVVSVIGIFASVYLMTAPTVLIDWVEQTLDQTRPGWRDENDWKAISSGTRYQGYTKNEMNRMAISSGLPIVGMILLIAFIFDTVFAACLVHGARTRNVCLMKPWIVLTGIVLILDVIHNLILLVSGHVAAIGNVLPWMLFAYFFQVVLLFKKEIEDEAGTGEDCNGKGGSRGDGQRGDQV